MNTIELLKAASNNLGLSPADTMFKAQRLYERGFISYPRTETTAYPKNVENFNKIPIQLCSTNETEWSIKGRIDENVSLYFMEA